MKNLSFRNRISFYFITVTAVLIAVLFLSLYFTVLNTVYDHLDSDLEAETYEVNSGIVVLNNQFVFSNENEWQESEHGRMEVNPVFIEVVDTAGKIIRKTPNLRSSAILFHPNIKKRTYYNSYLSGAQVRQLQTPVVNPTGKTLGYLLIAVPLRESLVVLENLGNTLVIGYPLVLVILFWLSRFIAGTAIAPVNKISSTAARITNENLDERIELPPHKDEILILTQTINQLLDRLGDVISREKQFTADASHELRTPLAVIKGTLEVLIRKPRDTQQYVEKISHVISEVDRISLLVDQLLELSHYESSESKPAFSIFNLPDISTDVIARLKPICSGKNINITFKTEQQCPVYADQAMTEVILENLIINAVKYSSPGSSIELSIYNEQANAVLSVTDQGIGIPADQIDKIFDRFYRIDQSRSSKVSGKGLGLSIVKKLADLQSIQLTVLSIPSVSTTFTLVFPADQKPAF